MKELYRINELAERWGVHERTIRRMIENGEIDAVKIRSAWRVSTEAIKNYEQEHHSKKMTRMD